MRPRRMKIASDELGHEEQEVPASRDAQRTSHRSPTRMLLHPAAIFAMAVLVGYVALAVVLNVVVDTDRVRGWLAPRASAALNRPVSVGAARVALLPRPSIHVSEVRIDNLEGFDGPALAFIERVRLDLSWLPLLIGRAQVHRIRLDGPRIYVAVDEAGTSNFGDLVPTLPAEGPAPDAPVPMFVQRLEVSDGSLSYFNAPTARSFTISGAEARARVSPEGAAGWRADIEVESDTLLVRVAALTDEILSLAGPTLQLTASSDGTGRTVDIHDGVAELSGASVALRGRITGLDTPRPRYDLQITNDSLDASVLAAAFPVRARSTLIPALDGRLGVTFQVTSARTPGRPPLTQGSLYLDGIGMRMSGNTMVADLTGTIGVSRDSIALDSLTGRFAEGPFELSGVVSRETRALALRTHANPDLDALDRLGFVPGGFTVSGDATVDLSLIGRLDALDSLEFAGTVAFEGLQAKHARIGVPLYVPAGEVSLSGDEVAWTDLTVLLGQDDVVTTGRLMGLRSGNADPMMPPEVHATVRGVRVDLGAILSAKEGAPSVSYGQVAFAHLGDGSIDGTPATRIASELGLRRPHTLPIRGDVTLEFDTLDFRRYRLEAVTARLEMADSTLSLDAPSFALWGGAASGALHMGIGGGKEEPFVLALAVDSASAEDLLSAWTPAGTAITGTLRLDLEARGALDPELLPIGATLAGHASLSITNGRVHDTGPNMVVADFLGSPEWSDVPFESWDTEIDLVEGQLHVRTSDLVGEQGRIAFEGLVDLDGSHDLAMGVSIPPDRLGTVSLRRTGIGQSVLDQLSDAGSSLDLGLRMSGDFSGPQLETDASNAIVLAR